MIRDVTGMLLTPGNQGLDCPGNGTNPDVECCCDECDYMQCCLDVEFPDNCTKCKDGDCPWAGCRVDDIGLD